MYAGVGTTKVTERMLTRGGCTGSGLKPSNLGTVTIHVPLSPAVVNRPLLVECGLGVAHCGRDHVDATAGKVVKRGE